MSHERPQSGFSAWSPPSDTAPGAVGPTRQYGQAPGAGHGVGEAPPPPFVPAMDVVPYSGQHRAGPNTRRSTWLIWTGAGVGLVSLVAAVVALVPKSAARITERVTKTIVLAHGYSTFTGKHGLTPPAGAPWGVRCAPVVFQLTEQAPPSLHFALRQVLQEGQAGGLNVALANADGTWDATVTPLTAEATRSAKVVVISTDAAQPPPLPDGGPRTMTMGWSTQVSPDQSTEFLTMESARVFTAVASDPLTQRRAMRFIVAWSQGISGSTVPGTGIAHHLAKSADAFSADDLAALRTMSGCA